MLMFNISLLCIGAFLGIVTNEHGPCEVYSYGCCPHTRWDSENNRCIECQAGYYWINCSKTCQYPTFGRKCKETCSCESERCDFMNGCVKRYTEKCDQKNTTENIIKNKYSIKIKFIMLMVITSVLCVILLAYIAVVIVEKQRNKTPREQRNQL